MVTTPDKLNLDLKISEPELIVEDFKQKLIVSLRKEKERIRETAEKESKLILAKAYQDSANLTKKAQDDAKEIRTQAKEDADQQCEAVLSQAQRKAEQLINSAQEIVQKDAKERTKKEVENILHHTKEEAAKLSNKILMSAKEEANRYSRQIITEAEFQSKEILRVSTEMRQKAISELSDSQRKASEITEQIIASAKKNAVIKAEREAEEIITQARVKAQKEREAVLASAIIEAKKATEAEANRLINKARQEAEDIINQAKEKVQEDLEESSRLMLALQQKMHKVIGGTESVRYVKPSTSNTESNDIPNTPAFTHHEEKKNAEPQVSRTEKKIAEPIALEKEPVKSEPSNKTEPVIFNEEDQTYQGKLRIDITPPVNNDQLSNLELSLQKASNLKVVHTGNSEDGSAWIEIEITKPLQLLDILRKTSGVKDVVGCKSYIIIAMKSKSS